jgi:hypothetical protein
MEKKSNPAFIVTYKMTHFMSHKCGNIEDPKTYALKFNKHKDAIKWVKKHEFTRLDGCSVTASAERAGIYGVYDVGFPHASDFVRFHNFTVRPFSYPMGKL